MENNKKIIIGVVLLLALLNGVAVFFKVLPGKQEAHITSPFDQIDQQTSPGQVYLNPDNGQMSMLPQTQPFVTAPQVYGSIYENPSNSYDANTQDYSSWSVDWEKSRTNQ